MPTTYRLIFRFAVMCLLTASTFAQTPPANEIVANQNRTPAGKLENGVLNVQLELREGAWRPEADDGPQLFVQALGEAGRAAQIPGPMLRMTEGTRVRVTVANKLKIKGTVYGLNRRPGNRCTSERAFISVSRHEHFIDDEYAIRSGGTGRVNRTWPARSLSSKSEALAQSRVANLFRTAFLGTATR